LTSKLFPVFHDCRQFTSTIDSDLTFTWTGDLESAVLSGVLKCDTPGLFGNIQGVLLVNGIEAARNDIGGGPIHFEFPFNVDVKNWIRQGGNRITAQIITTWGIISVVQFCVDLDLTVTSTGDVQPPEPPIPPESTIAWELIAAAILIIVVVMVLAKELKR